MEFACSTCKYQSDTKKNVKTHIDAKCNGAEILIVKVDDIFCEYCNKSLNTRPSLRRHLKTCKVKKSNLEEENKQLKEENKQLKEKTKKSENPENSKKLGGGQINQTNNITNNITQVNIILNNYNDTDLSKLTDKLISDLIIDADESYKIIPNLIKHVHFDPETPENHNICLPNKNSNNKYMQVYREGQWQAAIKNTEVDNIISDKETQLGDWVTEKGKKFPEARGKYEEYLEQKYEPDIAKLIKEEVELILYNGRHMIKNKLKNKSA